MSLVLDAIRFADERHAGQVRKGSGEAYFSHPLAVSYLVAGHKRSKKLDEILAAAILHDILEDTDTTFAELAERFGPLVASLVLELTSDPEAIAALGKKEYLKRKLCGVSSYALTLKLADRLHNVSDRPARQALLDTVEIIEHLRSRRRLSAPQTALAEAILARCREALGPDFPEASAALA